LDRRSGQRMAQSEGSRRLRAPFRLVAPIATHVFDHVSTVCAIVSSYVNAFVDGTIEGRNRIHARVRAHPYVKAITRTAAKAETAAESTARPYVEPVLGYVRPARPYLPGVFLAFIAVLLPPAIVTCLLFVLVTAPFWIPFLFFTAFLWIPFVLFMIAMFTAINFVVLVRLLSSPSVQSRIESICTTVGNYALVRAVLYDTSP